MKKGYFFVSDAIIAFFILFLGTLLAMSFFYHDTPQDQVSLISVDILNFLYSKKPNDINSPLIGPGGELHDNKNITDLEIPLLLQIGELYYRNQTNNCDFCLQLIEDIFEDISNPFKKDQYSFAFYIENEKLYNHSSIPHNKSEVLIPSKTIIQGVYKESEVWGPYNAEVWVWRN